jgi:hypothetical protein
MPRAKSELSPKAFACVTNWEMLPGNTRTKKIATIHPTGTRHRVGSTRLAPSAISTTPEAMMTKSAFNGR